MDRNLTKKVFNSCQEREREKKVVAFGFSCERADFVRYYCKSRGHQNFLKPEISDGKKWPKICKIFRFFSNPEIACKSWVGGPGRP
jgi:hypothetical protein